MFVVRSVEPEMPDEIDLVELKDSELRDSTEASAVKSDSSEASCPSDG
jgi:hypothetical protein